MCLLSICASETNSLHDSRCFLLFCQVPTSSRRCCCSKASCSEAVVASFCSQVPFRLHHAHATAPLVEKISVLADLPYIHTYIRKYINTYIYTSIHPPIHTSIHTYVRTYIHTYKHTTQLVHTQLTHTYSSTHNLLHTNPSPSLFSFLLSPCHLYLSFAACWKKLTCGVIRSFNFGKERSTGFF